MADLWTEKLDLYVDGELTTDDERALADHMRQCTACASEVAARLRLKQEVRNAGKQFFPEGTFVRRMQSKLAPRRRSFRLEFALAAVAVVVLLALISLQLFQPRRTPVELADLHVTALASSAPVDVVSSDRHTVKPWFQGKIPFTFNLPELQGTGFTLLGGRLVYMNQSPVAQLIYQVRQHKISVFIMQERDALRVPGGMHTELTFTTNSWRSGGLLYVIVGDASQEDIRKLGDLLQSAEHQ